MSERGPQGFTGEFTFPRRQQLGERDKKFYIDPDTAPVMGPSEAERATMVQKALGESLEDNKAIFDALAEE